MPTERARKGAASDKRKGKKASTQAGNYVREQMDKMKHSKSGRKPKSRAQAIAIGLSEARHDGVKVAKKSKTGGKRSSGGAAKGSSTSARKGAKTGGKARKSSGKSAKKK